MGDNWSFLRVELGSCEVKHVAPNRPGQDSSLVTIPARYDLKSKSPPAFARVLMLWYHGSHEIIAVGDEIATTAAPERPLARLERKYLTLQVIFMHVRDFLNTQVGNFARLLGLAALFLFLALVTWASPWFLVRYGASFVLLWVLPGLAWGLLLPLDSLRRDERLVVSLGLNFVITPITILLASYVPGPLTLAQLLIALAGVTILPLALTAVLGRVHRQEVDGQEPSLRTEQGSPTARSAVGWPKAWAWLLVAVLIVVGLRATNLGYSEFQGDESVMVMRAARALEGDDGILFRHKKAPAEMTLVMGTWRLTGILNEWMARLPFTWANVLGIMAVFLVCRRIRNARLGGVAVALIAIEGYFVAFGRIAQYQSLVYVLSTLGLLCLFVYYVEGRRSLILVSAALFAGGALAHYDVLLTLPAGLLLIGARLWSNRQEIRPTVGSLLGGALLAVVLIGLFYVPFFRDPFVARTSAYLATRVGGGVDNNLQATFVRAAVYDSIYYLVVIVLALALTVLATWIRWGRVGGLVAGLLLVATVTATVWPDLWLVGGASLAWVPFTALLLGVLLAPDQSIERRVVWVWFCVPALFYLFFVDLPRTHVHTFFTAWIILASMGLIEVSRWLSIRPRAVRWIACTLGLGLYVLSGYYAIVMFVDHSPEYRRNFPEAQYAIYWTPYEKIPREGLFGFPYRAGWKAVGYLVDRDELGAHYNSNEEPVITDYYARQDVRWWCAKPDVYITVPNVQDEVYMDWEELHSEYEPSIEVTVGGEPRLTIHRRTVSGPPEVFPIEDYEWKFDQGTTPDKYVWPPSWVEPVTPFAVGEVAKLVGYQVDSEHAYPGGYVELVLVWEGLGTVTKDYTVFTHLHDGVAMRGQLDNKPLCDEYQTTWLRIGEAIVDAYRIPVWDDTPPGKVSLNVGMYDLETLDRLPVFSPDGQVVGDSIHVTDIQIRNR